MENNKKNKLAFKQAIADVFLEDNKSYLEAVDMITKLLEVTEVQQNKIDSLDKQFTALTKGLESIAQVLKNFSEQIQNQDAKVEELEYTCNEIITLIKGPAVQPDLPVLFNKKDVNSKPN